MSFSRYWIAANPDLKQYAEPSRFGVDGTDKESVRALGWQLWPGADVVVWEDMQDAFFDMHESWSEYGQNSSAPPEF